jgi:hypothetical protein
MRLPNKSRCRVSAHPQSIYFFCLLIVSGFFLLRAWDVAVAVESQQPKARWISATAAEPCPVNRFFYFRKEVKLTKLDGEMTLHFAADSNAHLWMNGQIVRRKVTRYFEPSIRTETIDARRYLHVGENTVVVLNHSWGPITTFQRSGCRHAGIFVASSWLVSDDTWKVQPALEFGANNEQILGVPSNPKAQGDHRIRFAQFLYGDQMPSEKLFAVGFDDSGWASATVVQDGPWPVDPAAVETPGQRGENVSPILLLAQGRALEPYVQTNDPIAIESAMLHATYQPRGSQALALDPAKLSSLNIKVSGRAGETKYITFDFGKPVHGFPFIGGTASKTKPTIDFAYSELNISPSTGKLLVNPSGWLNPEAIVGKGYIDRYYARTGPQHFELPDERTARWWTIHIYFPQEGSFQVTGAGFVSSQYPVDMKGSFSCGDKRIDAIVRLSLEHALVSMSDTYVDTPGREDGQWLEDARLRAQLAAQWFGDVKLRQVLLRLAAESQRPDGRLHPFPPSNYPIAANADWAAEWVGALYDDYLWTGDTSRIHKYWPQVTKWWAEVLAKVDADGLWRDDRVFADIRIGVHPSANQSSGIASAQMIQRLSLSIEMANAIGDSEQAAAWTRIHDRMLIAFRRDHLVPAANGIPLHVDDVADPANSSVKRGFSQAAQAMAIEGGLLTPEEASENLDYSFTAPNGSPTRGVDRWNNPTYLYRSLNALTICGDSSRALQHLLERFGPYLPGDTRNPSPAILQGPWGGPLPEYWISREDLGITGSALNPAQPTDPTGSHGWNSVALVWLHDSLLGVRILQPGGSLLQIKPVAAGLSYVEGTTMSPKGAVFVSWKPALSKLEIHLPPEVRAVVVLPPELERLQSSKQLSVPSECEIYGTNKYSCTGDQIFFGSTATKK